EAKLSFGLRGRGVAICERTGLRAVDQGAGRTQESRGPTFATGFGDARDHRVSPAFNALGDRTDSRRGRRWRHANAARTRVGRASRPGRGDWTAEYLRNDGIVPRIFRFAQPGRFARRG